MKNLSAVSQLHCKGKAILEICKQIRSFKANL